MPVYTQVTSMKDTIFPFFKLLYSFLGILLTTVCYYSRGHCWNTCIIMLYSVFTVSSTKIKSSTNYNGFSVSKLILWTIKLSRFNYLPYISDLNVHPRAIYCNWVKFHQELFICSKEVALTRHLDRQTHRMIHIYTLYSGGIVRAQIHNLQNDYEEQTLLYDCVSFISHISFKHIIPTSSVGHVILIKTSVYRFKNSHKYHFHLSSRIYTNTFNKSTSSVNKKLPSASASLFYDWSSLTLGVGLTCQSKPFVLNLHLLIHVVLWSI